MTALLTLYTIATRAGEPLLKGLLNSRIKKGKEDPTRLHERMGDPKKSRPQGPLIWIHAASVGEAQSALILIHAIEKKFSHYNILVTTGTVTSATLMEQRLPSFAFHQYAPVDHPDWIDNFLLHWTPDLAIWMESELWPNTLSALKEQNIPTILVNARLSDKSFSAWSRFPKTARKIISAFDMVLTQTDIDAKRFSKIGATNVHTTDNIKYSAAPLPCNPMAFAGLRLSTSDRKLWLFASTHDGEEEMACRIHKKLKYEFPNLLTIIVPRHPIRRDEIAKICENEDVSYVMRSKNHALPKMDTDVYVADTLGELGLFYSICPTAVIGRSFSRDGGGGHNPIEAAQLDCVVLTGPNNQFQRPLYDDMGHDGAVIEVNNENELCNEIRGLMVSPTHMENMKKKTNVFVSRKTHVVEHVMNRIYPFLSELEHKNAA